jgi:hypothetical protein
MLERRAEEDGMTFRAKPEFLVISELEQLMRTCPSAESFRMVSYKDPAGLFNKCASQARAGRTDS